MKKIFKESLPLLLSSLAVILYMRMDQLMIKSLLGAKELGIYSVVVRLTEVWFFIPLIISNSTFPRLLQKETSERNYLLSSLVPCLFIILNVLIFKELAISYLYGEGFIEFIATISNFRVNIYFNRDVLLKILVSHQLQKFTLYTTLLGVSTNFLCNTYLIPRMGVLGASISTLISYSISAYFGFFFFSQTRSLVLPGKKLCLHTEKS